MWCPCGRERDAGDKRDQFGVLEARAPPFRQPWLVPNLEVILHIRSRHHNNSRNTWMVSRKMNTTIESDRFWKHVIRGARKRQEKLTAELARLEALRAMVGQEYATLEELSELGVRDAMIDLDTLDDAEADLKADLEALERWLFRNIG
jgi:hypothetical protein